MADDKQNNARVALVTVPFTPPTTIKWIFPIVSPYKVSAPLTYLRDSRGRRARRACYGPTQGHMASSRYFRRGP